MLSRRSALALLAAATGCRALPTEPLLVFAAASLKTTLDLAGAAFTAAGGGPIRLSYAASSLIARQIEQGAPADVFVSADTAWMDYLAQRRLIVPQTRRDLFSNRLALIAPAASPVRLQVTGGMPLARALGAGRLAMAAPDVPAGRYGRAALQALGVWESVEDRVVAAENVRVALAYVARAEAPLGIVYDTDARAEPRVRIVGLFPETSHPRIVYPGAVTARSRHPQARAVMAFLAGPEARGIFTAHGFAPLDP